MLAVTMFKRTWATRILSPVHSGCSTRLRRQESRCGVQRRASICCEKVDTLLNRHLVSILPSRLLEMELAWPPGTSSLDAVEAARQIRGSIASILNNAH